MTADVFWVADVMRATSEALMKFSTCESIDLISPDLEIDTDISHSESCILQSLNLTGFIGYICFIFVLQTYVLYN